MKRVLVILLYIFGLGGPALAPAEGPMVVATIYPLTLIANDLGRGWLETIQLLDNNQEPHHISLKISQRKQIDRAPLILWVGPELENFLVKPMSVLPDNRKLALSDAASANDVDKKDPHYWLQPLVVKRYYRLLADRLAARFPNHVDLIEMNYERALEQIERALDAAGNSPIIADGRSVLVEHQAYGHYTDYFGITIAGALVDSRGVSEGARTITRLRAKTNASCVIVEQLPPGKGIANIAAGLNLSIVAIDPLGRSVSEKAGYAGLVDEISRGFQRCFASLSGSQ